VPRSPTTTTRTTRTPRTNGVGRPPGIREKSAQATREAILRAAIKVFAKHGFDGGSVEKISTAAKSVDRMIYYYFGNKEGLFVAALEEIYRRFNEAEAKVEFDLARPIAALETMVLFVVRYYRAHPEFVSLLNSENLHRGKHIAKSRRAREYSSPAVGTTARVLQAGVAQGLFRADVAARDLYVLIAACGYFHESNRYTLSAFLGEDLQSPEALAHWERFVVTTVLRAIATDPRAILQSHGR
jgi:AcrR family transcriptional regulator